MVSGAEGTVQGRGHTFPNSGSNAASLGSSGNFGLIKVEGELFLIFQSLYKGKRQWVTEQKVELDLQPRRYGAGYSRPLLNRDRAASPAEVAYLASRWIKI